MKTPVVFIIFNRPSQTKRVFETIRAARPETLLVIADGPRREEEKEKCDETRAVIDTVDWPCTIIKRYSDTNRGARKTLAHGLIWAFSHVERAIVLEADCLPHASFYPFCEELLERYKDDERVMHIGGNFFQQRNRKFHCNNSYYFSILPHIWGFATWARAWKHYDPDMKQWPAVRESGFLRSRLTDPAVYEYWETTWNKYFNHQIDSWDGQWTFACLMRDGLSINPSVNLVSNIGFGPDALHTTDVNSIFADIPVHEMKFPLTHPTTFAPDEISDRFTWRQNFGINRKLSQRILGPIRRRFPRGYGMMRRLLK